MKVRHYLTGEIREVVRIWQQIGENRHAVWVFDDGRRLRLPDMLDWHDWDENAEVTPVTPKS
jgi:hypothetical protein